MSFEKPRSLWALYLLTLFLLIGTGIAGYLTWHHENQMYGSANVALANCPETQTTNCEIVNTSQYSELFGVPLAALAIPVYLLLLGLIFFRQRSREDMQSVFAIGILLSLFSVYLYYVSTIKVGFLCLWCLRLYLIHFMCPLLSGIYLRKKPTLRHNSSVFTLQAQKWNLAMALVLLAGTVGLQKVYRATLKPTVSNDNLIVESGANWDKGAFKIPAPLKLLQKNGRTRDFNLQSKIGKGRPVALFFHIPGYAYSEQALVEIEKFIRETSPRIDFYVVISKEQDSPFQTSWEFIKALPLPENLTVLVDPNHEVQKRLDALERPFLTLITSDGTLVALKLPSLNSPVEPTKDVKTLIREVAEGKNTIQYKSIPRYYPSSDLVGKCAPTFTLNELNSGEVFDFNGKSNGKPTFLVFWSSTCSHCVVEIPKLIKHQAAHPGKYNIVSVSNIKLDKEDGTSHRRITQTFVKNAKVLFPVLTDSGRVSELYGVNSTPTTFIIAPNGEISEVWTSAHSNLNASIENALAKVKTRTGACQNQGLPRYSRMNFNITTHDGKKTSLAKIVQQPSLIHFWATWCGPCQEELPELLEFSKKLDAAHGKLHLISVQKNEDAKVISDFLAPYGKEVFSFRNPEGGVASQIGMGYEVPRTFLVGSHGEILTFLSGSQNWKDPHFQERIFAWLQLSKK